MEIFGWGKKNTADVTDQGELKVIGAAEQPEGVVAAKGEAYTFDIDAVGVNGAEHLCVLKNGHSTKFLIVTSVTLWVATYKSTTFLEVRLNETFTYAAEGDAIIPTNLISGKVGGALGDFYAIAAAGTDITTFGGTAMIAGRNIFTTTSSHWEKGSGWHIPPGQVFSLWNNGNDNTYSGYISFYYKGNG